MQTSLAISKDELLLEEIRQELSRRNYKDYIEYVHHGLYQHYPHTELICEAIQPIADGQPKRVIIELPPRHSKSMTITETFPSYFVGRNPNKSVIAASYSDSLARKFGRMNRDKVFEFGKRLFDVSLSHERSASNNWGVEKTRGGMIATGIGGSITGEGADLLIIDDPIKNAAEANSKVMRERVWSEWESTLSTRLHKNSSIIIVMTRWHEDDLVGRLLKESPHEWDRVRLPAIAEDEDDLLGREIGEALGKGLGYDEEWAELKKKEVGSRVWASLFQQRPSPASGNIFKREWWQYYDTLPKRFNEVIQSWDLTFKDGEGTDFVVGQVWGRKGADVYLIDQYRKRADFPETIQAIRSMSRRYPEAKAKLIEDKANGPAVISTLKRELQGIIPIEPRGNKVERAQAITPIVEGGNVYLPKGATFTGDFIEECTSFPNGENDDMVDAMTQALDRLSNRTSAMISSTNAW